MSKQLLLSIFLLACLMSLSARVFGQRTPIPPGVREADKQTNASFEPPATFKQKPADPGLLRQEAAELAKLSAALPSQMDQVSQGKSPKDLGDELKRIESWPNTCERKSLDKGPPLRVFVRDLRATKRKTVAWS